MPVYSVYCQQANDIAKQISINTDTEYFEERLVKNYGYVRES